MFRTAALLALVVAVPVTSLNMVVGSRFGIVATELQPMKISGAEALWQTQQPASFSLFQVGGFTAQDPDPSFQIAIPGEIVSDGGNTGACGRNKRIKLRAAP